MTRVLIAPQEFKGTLTAQQAVDAMHAALRDAKPGWEFQLLPLADGGPGTVHLVLRRVPNAAPHTATVEGPLGHSVEATWAVLPPGDVAVIEMAAASGLTLVPKNERLPLRATTTGTGQLIRAALETGCRRIIIGAGGSATNDGGLGAVRALGVRFLDEVGLELTTPAELSRLASVDLTRRDPRLDHAQLEVWTDVRNPLLGTTGATRVFGPQKGATPAQLDTLEKALERLVQVTSGHELARRPGAGAAGGLAWGLARFCDAVIRPGFLSLAALLSLDAVIDHCDLVVTGEGRLDAQTAFDKGPWALARLARLRGKPVTAFVGECGLEPKVWRERFDDIVVLTKDAIDHPALALSTAVARWAANR